MESQESQGTIQQQLVTNVQSSEMDYSKKSLSHSQYKMHQITPVDTTQKQIITTGIEVIFNLPNKVWNPAKSVFQFHLTPAAVAGADTHNVLYKNFLASIRQIQLRTNGGQEIVNLNMCNRYLDTVFFPETSLEELMTYNKSSHLVGDGYSTGVNVSDNLKNNVAVNEVALLITSAADGVTIAQESATSNYTERMYYQTGTTNESRPVQKLRIPMSMLKNTFLSIDKNFYFGEVLELKFIFDARDAIGYKITANAGNNLIVNGANVAAASTFNLNNVYYYMAVESDLNIANGAIRLFNSGLSVPIPYVYSSRIQSTGKNQAVSLRYNRGHGKKIRRIFNTVSHDTESLYTNYIRDNIGGKIINEYYTTLNNDRLQDNNIICTDYKDYMIHQPKIKGSTIQSAREYQYKWFHCDDFTSPKPLHHSDCQDINYSSGVPLDTEQKYDINYTFADGAAARNFIHYSFIIVERELIIKPGQTMIY